MGGPTLQERKIGAIVGAAVADAAAQPLHWIYNLEKLHSVVGEKEEVEFWRPSQNPFYCIDTGKATCYGDQAFVVLASLAAKGDVDPKDIKERLYQMFGPNSEYDSDANAAYKWKSGVQKTYPIQGPWKHFSIKDFLEKYSNGEEETGSEKDTQIDGVTKVAPVVAMFAGKPEMLDKVEQMVRITQDNDLAVVAALAGARLLEHYILNGPDPEAVDKVIRQLEDPDRNNAHDLDKAVVGHLRKVQTVRGQPHFEVTTKVFKND